MRSYEHRALGDEATGRALVNVGGDSPDERLMLSFGDVVALSGDYFAPERPADGLFRLGAIGGAGGTAPRARDELVCALKVMAVDEVSADPRFVPGGEFSGYDFSERADRSDVERRVRDRYLGLAATNDDHFVAPGRSDAATGSGCGAAPSAYRHLHERALDEAWRLGRVGGDLSRAMAREAAAQHYLTDGFAAGHLRTPVAEIRRYWHARYPRFWDRLQRRVASDTARALREVSLLLRLVPRRLIFDRTFGELTARTSQYPELSLGDLVARAFHDWDNSRGLAVEGGVVFGDGHVDEGVTRELAVAAVRAGVDDVALAFELGRSGHRAPGNSLYHQVREATGVAGAAFRAEERIPRPTEVNQAQNWHAPDVETLWASPMVGATGPTVGDAIEEMLRPDGEFIRQLEGLGEGLAGSHGILAAPVVGPWLVGHCCHAYRRGFVEPLSQNPAAAVLDLVGEGQPDVTAGSSSSGPNASAMALTGDRNRRPETSSVRIRTK